MKIENFKYKMKINGDLSLLCQSLIFSSILLVDIFLSFTISILGVYVCLKVLIWSKSCNYG